jgi:hypothetical protein
MRISTGNPRSRLAGIGRDSGDNVSQEYKSPGAFTGGTILGVAVNVGKDQYLNLEQQAVAAFAVE